MDVFFFNQVVRHGQHAFVPGSPYGFEDPDAAPYFAACGWGEVVDAEPALIITTDEIDIDPCTIWADGPNKWKFVMPDRAAAARGSTLEDAQAFVWDGIEVLKAGLGENADG